MSNLIRILCVLALAVVTVGPVSAATITNGPTLIAQATSATVSGRITDSQTGGPVVNATVTLKGPSTYTATTDASGSFSVSNVTPGIYSVSITKTGYNPLTQDTLVVLAGASPNISGQIQPITFTTLRTIASVRSTGRGTFNVTPASVAVVTAQTIQEQGQAQVMQVLNQTPGILASFPSTSANGAAPGAITFPDIRGALSFETASLVDGHPVSVGTFGDYVSTFIPAFMLGNIEVVKGPGVAAPNVNYAIGGTVNYSTKDPTYTPQGFIGLGVDNRGSTLIHFAFTGTAGRLGYAFGLANDNLSSGLDNYQAIFSPSVGTVGILNWNGTTGRSVAFNDASITFPGTISTSFANFNLIGCCEPIQDLYQSKSYLAKLRYRVSPVTSATFTYLGAQSYANQNANTGSFTVGSFFCSPGPSNCVNAGYTGSIPNGTLQPVVFVRPGRQREVQNEPILQGDIRTSVGNDTILARYYAAGIHRLLFEGSDNPGVPEIMNVTLYGNDASTAQNFSGQTVPMAFFNYFNQAEDDVLHGWSLEWNHPFNATNSLTVAVDQTSSSTVSYSVGSANTPTGATGANVNIATFTAPVVPSVTLPKGSSQLFSTAMARLQWQLSPKWNATLAGYYNIYNSTFPTASVNGGSGLNSCQFNGNNCVFSSAINNHWDERLAFEYRPNSNLALRFSAGTAIAPPYLQLLSGLASTISFSTQTGVATQRINTGGLKPETAFGYDVGGDYRFRDGYTTLSGDVYLTTLQNHFLSYEYDSGTVCPAIDPVSGQATPNQCAGKPLFYISNRNLADARFIGLELALKSRPPVGFGYTVQGALQRGYAYALPACFYSTTINPATHALDCTAFNTNLAIIPNQNFTGNGEGGNGCGCNGFSNHAIPYAQGYAELNYRFPGGSSVYIGDQYQGKNNSAGLPPFWIMNAGTTLQFGSGVQLQINGYNLTNTYNNVFPTFGGGVPIPIASYPCTGVVNPAPPAAPTACANVNASPPGLGQAAGTMAQAFGPSRWQFQLIKRFGPGTTP
ncbi:MAG TPA: TonB-dependent receptor [Candidatus Rubrimentiphilum sp.]|nr:TonB-dependent receptor [Candidatus Rubrimentiphilum sp.]